MFGYCVQERMRLSQKFPGSMRQKDEESLQELLAKAKQNSKQKPPSDLDFDEMPRADPAM